MFHNSFNTLVYLKLGHPAYASLGFSQPLLIFASLRMSLSWRLVTALKADVEGLESGNDDSFRERLFAEV